MRCDQWRDQHGKIGDSPQKRDWQNVHRGIESRRARHQIKGLQHSASFFGLPQAPGLPAGDQDSGIPLRVFAALYVSAFRTLPFRRLLNFLQRLQFG